MCIIIKRNKIHISDSKDVNKNNDKSPVGSKVADRINETKDTKNKSIFSAISAIDVSEYPEEWNEHITKREFCALLKEQLSSVMDARSQCNKELFRDKLMDLIKASIITYNANN